jgi:hypothetical protein
MIFMRYLTKTLVFLLSAFSISSCVSHSRLIGTSETDFGRIRFYLVDASDDNTSVSKVYANVDSNNIKKYYSFYPDKIVMRDQRAKNLSYKVTSQKIPDNYDTKVYHRFSRLDTLVFGKAKEIVDTSTYSYLKGLQGAAGYFIEVNYYHGFPKGRKFKPL